MIYVIDNTMVVDNDGHVSAEQVTHPFGNFIYTRGCNLYNSLRLYYPDVIPFKEVYDENNNKIWIIPGSIIFIHSGEQVGFDDFLNQHINSCYFICYSGDPSPKPIISQKIAIDPKQVIFDNLTNLITADEILKKWDLARFVDSIRSDKQNCLSYLKKSGKPYLSALSILCVGYLAQHNCKEFEVFLPNTPSREGLKNIDIWKKVLGTSLVEASANLELDQLHGHIESLLTAIYCSNDNLLVFNCDDMKSVYEQIAIQGSKSTR